MVFILTVHELLVLPLVRSGQNLMQFCYQCMECSMPLFYKTLHLWLHFSLIFSSLAVVENRLAPGVSSPGVTGDPLWRKALVPSKGDLLPFSSAVK